MLYFILANKQEFSWHVGSGIPRIATLESIYADGHELQYLQRLGYETENINGSATLSGTRAINALRAMRLDAATNLSPPEPATPSPNGEDMVGNDNLPVWWHNKLITFWDLTAPEQSVYAAAYGGHYAISFNKSDHTLSVARNALYSFWRRHGNPRFKFPAAKSFRFADDDWGY